MPWEQAQRLAEAAVAAWEAENWTVAAERYAAMVDRWPDAPPAGNWAYNAALAHKFRRDWPQAYAFGKQAAARAELGTEDPAFWNLGIAATIMHDWETARDAWRGYGLSVPDGPGEVRLDYGTAPVRLDPAGAAEVVWGQRLCPTRVWVASVPTPESGRHFGDIVVHDGVPNGERVVDGRTYPVFDELELWQPSGLPTLSVHVDAGTVDALESLLAGFHERNYGAEPASFTRPLCACCSRGTVQQERTVEAGNQALALGAPVQGAQEVLDAWAAADPQRRAWRDLEVIG